MQEWSRDLASNESGVLLSERVSVGEREIDSEREEEKERERVCVVVQRFVQGTHCIKVHLN